MMDRMPTLSREELGYIHNASMDILENTGICFNSDQAATLFRQNGFKTEGHLVFITQDQVMKALETVPPDFTVQARNPEKIIHIGGNDFAAMPTGGATKVALASGQHYPSTLEDFKACCKLVQTSNQLDLGGYLMVQPNDIPPETAHLEMISQYIHLCDKPIFGASNCGEAARDSIKMAGMAFGRDETEIRREPIVITVVNAMSPLQYSHEQTDVIMEMASWHQPVIITDMILAGSTGPISLPGLLALENAEILAGVVLAQLVNPGTPVVYGSTSAPMDMRTTIAAVGAPETIKIASATAQMAHYYHLPCRTGGALTDSHCLDAQAAAEGAVLLSTVVRNGAHFIFHSCGQLGSYISMSFEKWLIDEEILRNIREMIKPMEITPASIGTDLIKEVGVGGQYLTHPQTFARFKDLSQPLCFNRLTYDKWRQAGGKQIADVAGEALKKRMASYQKPPLDPEKERLIDEYIARRTEQYARVA